MVGAVSFKSFHGSNFHRRPDGESADPHWRNIHRAHGRQDCPDIFDILRFGGPSRCRGTRVKGWVPRLKRWHVSTCYRIGLDMTRVLRHPDSFRKVQLHTRQGCLSNETDGGNVYREPRKVSCPWTDTTHDVIDSSWWHSPRISMHEDFGQWKWRNASSICDDQTR